MLSEDQKRSRFEALVREHGADLFRYAMWICGNEALARDLVQETCLRAWKALHRLQNEKAARSWMITILRREYARTFERKLPPIANLDAVAEPASSAPEPDEQVEIRLLRAGIASLSKKYREPLLMQVVMGYSCQDIADELGISKNAVMTQLFRARQQLKEKLGKDGITGNIHELY
ncbi:MAG: sigma-70 family RNA polymerase sigma factor [Lysobacterales bacterium]|jgi:RNA polymerase sigma-70 factor (ECF subfamily)